MPPPPRTGRRRGPASALAMCWRICGH
jgi:hypothetical protein